MKKLAACDVEDILQVCVLYRMIYLPTANMDCQCSIPAFEGLLPEPFNRKLLRLLYGAAEWHALAKL